MIPAINWRIPATNQPGIVSTATLIPRNVVPQTTATISTAMSNIVSFKIKFV